MKFHCVDVLAKGEVCVQDVQLPARIPEAPGALYNKEHLVAAGPTPDKGQHLSESLHQVISLAAGGFTWNTWNTADGRIFLLSNWR
ncbi:Protein clueless [Frankliniella fusca]|uniref:Protein clueless n=1 Tax=Frankliniella fusca TaxID=407009 RepID=A0AAE1HSM4_9NEOP|nr:Protein clueless [Frankliniella fusca]